LTGECLVRKINRPGSEPVLRSRAEFPKPVAVGDRFELNLAGKLTKAIVIEVSLSPEVLADLNKQLAVKGKHNIDAVVIWTEDQK